MRPTRQRSAILQALRGGEALAAQELHGRLRAQGGRIGLATVYRTLRGLAEEGAVDVLRDDPTQARYRLCSTEHHHHLTCERCGRVEEIPDCEVSDWAMQVARRRGFRLRSHDVEIRGLCGGCAGRPVASMRGGSRRLGGRDAARRPAP